MLTSGTASARSVVLASSDAGLRTRLRTSLCAMRWTVREASGGAEAMAQMEEQRPEALLIDSWLPDLEAAAFAGHVAMLYPGVDLLGLDGDPLEGGMRSPRRHELLHAMREAQETLPSNTVAWAGAPLHVPAAGKSRWIAPPSSRGGAGGEGFSRGAMLPEGFEGRHGVSWRRCRRPARRMERQRCRR